MKLFLLRTQSGFFVATGDSVTQDEINRYHILSHEEIKRSDPCHFRLRQFLEKANKERQECS